MIAKPADMTQGQRILRHLMHHGKIDPITALREYGILRLAARIYDLRDEGHNIRSETVATVNRYGENVTHGIYYLSSPGRPHQQVLFKDQQQKEHTIESK